MWSTRRLNDMDPCPWSATPPLPTWRDTRTAGDSPLSGPALGHPGAEACRRHLRLIASLGTTCHGQDRAVEQQFQLTVTSRERPYVSPL
jgi:hypothetical protein